jgi:isocitrate/isopropylmalate dehydrogenase
VIVTNNLYGDILSGLGAGPWAGWAWQSANLTPAGRGC